MRRSSKWIESHPDDAPAQVGSRVLRSRLERMWRLLELAVEEPQSDIENVHQLRVFARRAAAALDIFAPLLPKRRGEWMRQRVKKVRQAAGAARDLDVLLLRWTDRGEPLAPTATSALLSQIKRHRRAAQKPIEKAWAKLKRQEFLRRVRKFARRVAERVPPEASHARYDEMARAALTRLVVPFLAAGRGELSDVESLHAFRIQGKQVRYAMEIFAGAFDAEFRHQLYPLVTTLQDRLGAINDYDTAASYFTRWIGECACRETRAALEQGLSVERQALAAGRHEFLLWWTRERQEELCQGFARYITQ